VSSEGECLSDAAAVPSEEAPKPEGGGDCSKSVTIDEGEAVTSTQAKSKKSKEDQPVITNIESLYFASTHLFQGLSVTGLVYVDETVITVVMLPVYLPTQSRESTRLFWLLSFCGFYLILYLTVPINRILEKVAEEFSRNLRLFLQKLVFCTFFVIFLP